MCRESQCTSSQLTGSLTYNSFVPAVGVSASFALGATTSCTDPLACGLLTLGNDVALPAAATSVCLGTVQLTTTALPVGSTHGLFFVRIQTGLADLRITDPACIPDITGGAQGSTVARIMIPPPPSPPPPSPPPSPPVSYTHLTLPTIPLV